MTQTPPAGWHADPFHRFAHRYWDGRRWTEHVATNGQQGIDPPVGIAQPTVARSLPTTPQVQRQPTSGAQAPGGSRVSNKIQKQVQKLGLAHTVGGPDLAILSEPILVINQKGKLVELRAEYAIYDRNGHQLAAVRGKRMSSRIQVVDMVGRSLLDMRREANIVSSKVIVVGDDGAKLGRIVPSKNWNQIDRRFKLEDASNEMIGAVYGEDRQLRRDFNVQDTGGSIVARINKTRAGLAKELFTKGDNYVVEFPGHLTGPLRLLTVATALVIDTWYHQR